MYWESMEEREERLYVCVCVLGEKCGRSVCGVEGFYSVFDLFPRGPPHPRGVWKGSGQGSGSSYRKRVVRSLLPPNGNTGGKMGMGSGEVGSLKQWSTLIRTSTVLATRST